MLEARAQLTPPLPVDPLDNKDVDAKEAAAVADDVDDTNVDDTNTWRRIDNDANPRRQSDATADVDDGLDTNARSRNAWAAAHAQHDLDSIPSSTTPAGPPRALIHAAVGSGRGCAPVVSPYRPSLRQKTIPKALHGSHPASRPTVNTTPPPTSVQRACIRGGAITSPRHSDRAIHPLSLGASRFDVICLVEKDYHAGMDGCDNLTEEFLQDCGYAHIKALIQDVVVCFNDIILVHNKVRELWYNAYAHTSGPQVDKILHKSISVFPQLASMRVKDVVGFYDRLQEVSMVTALHLCRLM